MGDALYFQDAAGLPGEAVWLRAADGIACRAVFWPVESARGTVVIFPGRTEYAEKYGRVAGDLAARGFACVAIDWRGQGLSDRLHDDPLAGHVERFADYQLDADALLAEIARRDMPRPLHMLAHSMGGCIGLRRLMGEHPFARAVFSAPMWGINMPPALRMFAVALSAASRPLGFSGRYAPGKSGESAFEETGFDINPLTTDRESWDWMKGHLRDHPDLALGGPTLHWLHEALGECRDLAGLPAPDLPALTLLGSEERIVDSQAIRTRMAQWPGGDLILKQGLRHEVLMENIALRDALIDRIVAHFLA